MAAVPYAKPSAFITAPGNAPYIQEAPIQAGQTLADGDLVTINAGSLVKGATGTATNIAGFMLQASGTNYYAGPGGSAAITPDKFFGASTTGQLIPASPILYKYYVPGGTDLVEMSLLQSYTAALNGTAAGITLDATTGIFVVDNTQTACLLIIRLLEGPPGYQPYGVGGVGDTGARVLVKFNTSALAI